MEQTNKIICKYDDWWIMKTESGLILQHSEFNELDTPVTEVYRFQPGEYEDKDIAELDQIVRKKGITYTVCGELDDLSGYVFWADEHDLKKKITIIVRDGILADVRIPVGMALEIEALQIDKDYPDYDKLREYEDKIYEDATMCSADITNISFEE